MTEKRNYSTPSPSDGTGGTPLRQDPGDLLLTLIRQIRDGNATAANGRQVAGAINGEVIDQGMEPLSPGQLRVLAGLFERVGDAVVKMSNAKPRVLPGIMAGMVEFTVTAQRLPNGRLVIAHPATKTPRVASGFPNDIKIDGQRYLLKRRNTSDAVYWEAVYALELPKGEEGAGNE